MKKSFCCLITLLALCSFISLEAAYTSKGGHPANANETATMSGKDHYNFGVEAFEAKNWNEAAKQFNIVAIEFPDSPYGADAYYFAGVAYYQIKEYDLANEAFNNYLKVKNDPKFFQEVIQYKFSIAEQFRGGARRRPFGTKQFPKWLSAYEEALDIYDEVVAALPSSDLAAQALFYKGCLMWKMGDFRGAIDSYQMLIRRFNKNELAPQAYLNITKIYLDQSKFEFQNPDLIALAEVNVRKFEMDYPRDERLQQAQYEVNHIKEVYARGLFETGQFYERKGKPKASTIYYENAVRRFPETSISKCCRRRLYRICPSILSRIEEIATEEASELQELIDDGAFDASEFDIKDL
ncbi:MAG: tetratricopeptide repeat protein [Chlamydiota bacterium]